MAITGATTNLSFDFIIGNGAGTVAQGVLLDNLGSGSSFTVTGSTILGRYTGDQIAITNLASNTQTISFGITGLNLNASGTSVAASNGLRIENITATDVNIDFGNTVAGQTAPTARGILVKDVNASATNFDLDFARLQLDHNGIGFEFDNFDSGTATVAGTTSIIRSVTDSIKITNSAGNVTFADTTTIQNTAVGFNGDGVDLSTNTGTYSFAGLTVITNGVGSFGLRATNSGTLNITGGTNFISSFNGTAVLINPTVVNAQFQNLTSINSTGNGVNLALAAGSTFTVAGSTTVNSSNSIGVFILGQVGTQTVSLGTLNINNAAAGAGLLVQNNSTGTVNINSTSGNVTTGTSTAIDFRNTSSGTITLGVALTGVTVNGASTGINVNQTGTGTIDGTLNTGTGGSIANNLINDVKIRGTSGTITIGQAITSTVARLVDIQSVSAGTVTLSGNITSFWRQHRDNSY